MLPIDINRSMRKQKRKEKILHKLGCIDNHTCFCKYMPLEWKEEARKKVDKTEVSTTWVLCRDDIMPKDCNGFWVPEFEVERAKVTLKERGWQNNERIFRR